MEINNKNNFFNANYHSKERRKGTILWEYFGALKSKLKVSKISCFISADPAKNIKNNDLLK